MDRDSMDMFMSNRFAGRTETFSDTEAKKAYEEASGINIEEQRELWNERGKGYWGEYKVFSVLFSELDFPNKILVNTRIPTENGRTTEIDLLLFAPTGVYVFEIKHYSGKVYGGYDKPTWTEYYKVRDSVTFDNPLWQNAYHLEQLKRLLPGTQFYSYVVFTNSKAEIKVGGRYPDHLTVTRLEDLTDRIREDFAGRTEIYSSEQIEKMFRALQQYSPMENKPDRFLKTGVEVLPFSGFAERMLRDLEFEKKWAREEVALEVERQTRNLRKERAEIQKIRQECIKSVEDVKLQRDKAVSKAHAERDEAVNAAHAERDEAVNAAHAERDEAVNAAIAERDEAIRELEEFKRNFDVVHPFESGYGVLNRDCLKIETKFEDSASFLHTTNMCFGITNQSKDLWFETFDSWLIVGLANGRVQKYVLREHSKDFQNSTRISPGNTKVGRLVRIFNASLDEIKYIKLCNVYVSDIPNVKKNITPGVEFEVYTAPGVESIYDTEEPNKVGDMNSGEFEINPDFMKSKVMVDDTANGEGCDVKLCFSACTTEVGFDLSAASLMVGTNSGMITEYPMSKSIKNFFSKTILPMTQTGTLVLHVSETKSDGVAFIKLKGVRVFRKESWQTDSIMPGVIFDIYPNNSEENCDK